MQTVRACIEQHAGATPDRPFLIAPESGKTLNFAQLKDAVDDVGRRLDQLGLPRGAKVSFLLNNGYWTLRLFLGVMASNRIIVPLNARDPTSLVMGPSASAPHDCDCRCR